MWGRAGLQLLVTCSAVLLLGHIGTRKALLFGLCVLSVVYQPDPAAVFDNINNSPYI